MRIPEFRQPKRSILMRDDGQEHATEREAQNHQELVNAFADHREARKAYALVLAKTIKTADGEPLLLDGRMRKYWWVPERYPNRPCLSQVSLYDWEIELGEDGMCPSYRYFDESYEDRQRGNKGDWRTIRPAELYASKEAAEGEFAKRTAVWAADQIRQMDQYGGGQGFAEAARLLDELGGLDPAGEAR